MSKSARGTRRSSGSLAISIEHYYVAYNTQVFRALGIVGYRTLVDGDESVPLLQEANEPYSWVGSPNFTPRRVENGGAFYQRKCISHLS
jgi:hypothetical protein